MFYARQPGVKWHRSDYASYSADNGSNNYHSYLFDDDYLAQFTWSGLELTISRSAVFGEEGEWHHIYYLEKEENLETHPTDHQPVEWDINENGKSDLADVVNALNNLTQNQ